MLLPSPGRPRWVEVEGIRFPHQDYRRIGVPRIQRLGDLRRVSGRVKAQMDAVPGSFPRKRRGGTSEGYLYRLR